MAGAANRAGAGKRANSKGPAAQRAAPAKPRWEPVPPARPPPVVAVAEPAGREREPVGEPVWLVRAVLVLFLVGFAAFLAREVYSFVQTLG